MEREGTAGTPFDGFLSSISFKKAVLVAPLIASNGLHELRNESENHVEVLPYFLLCPHGEASRVSLFVFTKACIQNFIAKTICSIRKYPLLEATSQLVGNKITKNFQESAELVSRLRTVCFQAFDKKKKQAGNFCFRVLSYSAIFVTRENKIDTKKDVLRLKQMTEAHEKLYCPTAFNKEDILWW